MADYAVSLQSALANTGVDRGKYDLIRMVGGKPVRACALGLWALDLGMSPVELLSCQLMPNPDEGIRTVAHFIDEKVGGQLLCSRSVSNPAFPIYTVFYSKNDKHNSTEDELVSLIREQQAIAEGAKS